MHSREQYLATLRPEYQRADKNQKSRLLDEAQKRDPAEPQGSHPEAGASAAAARRETNTHSGQGLRRRGEGIAVEGLGDLRLSLWPAPGGGFCGSKSIHCASSASCIAATRWPALLKRASPSTLDRLLAHERSVKQPRLPPAPSDAESRAKGITKGPASATMPQLEGTTDTQKS